MQFLNKNIFIINLIYDLKIIHFGMVVEYVLKKYLNSPQWLKPTQIQKKTVLEV